jgi:hypothetical protein
MNRSRVLRIVAKFAFEILVVVAGILIALFVNSMQQRHSDRERLNATLTSLSQEFQRNIENIHVIQPRLERFRDTLHFYRDRHDLSIYDLTVKAPGLTTAELHSTNWRATLSNNSLQLLDFATVTLLSRIEAKHQELKNEEMILMSMLYQPGLYKRGNEGSDYRKVLGVWLDGYLGDEQELIRLYEQFASEVGNYH